MTKLCPLDIAAFLDFVATQRRKEAETGESEQKHREKKRKAADCDEFLFSHLAGKDDRKALHKIIKEYWAEFASDTVHEKEVIAVAKSMEDDLLTLAESGFDAPAAEAASNRTETTADEDFKEAGFQTKRLIEVEESVGTTIKGKQGLFHQRIRVQWRNRQTDKRDRNAWPEDKGHYVRFALYKTNKDTMVYNFLLIAINTGPYVCYPCIA